jgi:hypothetical protein
MSTFEIVDGTSAEFDAVVKLFSVMAATGVGEFRAIDGTGVYIGPTQILTAAHIIYSRADVRPALTTYVGSSEIAQLMANAIVQDNQYRPDEISLPVSAIEVLPSAYSFIRDFELTGTVFNPRDIALIEAPALAGGHGVMSLGVAFGPGPLAAELWDGVEVSSAGFPRKTKVSEPAFDGGDLYKTTGTLTTDYDVGGATGTFLGLEVHSSQSGSGVWIIDPETGEQVLIGIVNVFDMQTFLGGGLLLTPEDYQRIVAAFEATGVTADQVPFEYLYGSDNGSIVDGLTGGTTETFTGTYLREVIRGDGGRDVLTGAAVAIISRAGPEATRSLATAAAWARSGSATT